MRKPLEKTTLSDFSVSIVVSAFTLMVGLLGFVNQLVQAKLFGTGLDMDSYLAVVAVPGILMGLIPTMIVSVVVPSLMKFKGDNVLGKQLRSTLLIFTVCGALFISIIGFFASGIFVSILLLKGSASLLSTAITTSRILWLATGLSLISNYLFATLYSQKKFVLPTVLSALPALFVIFCALLFASKIGTQSIALGLLVGVVIQIGILFPIWLKQGWSAAFFIRHPEIKVIFWRFPMMTLSQLPFSAPPMIAAYWAASLPQGSLSYVGYSYSLIGFLSVTISTGIAVVAFPKMAEAITAGANVQVLENLERRLRFIFSIAVPAAAFIIGLQEPILNLAFQRGKFDGASVEGIARVLPWFLLGMIAISCLNLLRNLYYSMGQFTKTGIMGVMITLIYGLLAGILINWFSYQGIGLAFGISSWMFLCVAMAWVPGKRNGLWSKELFRFGGKVVLTSGLASLVTHYLFSILSALPLLLRLALSAGLGCFIFMLISKKITHIYEYDELISRLLSIFLKKYSDLSGKKKDENIFNVIEP